MMRDKINRIEACSLLIVFLVMVVFTDFHHHRIVTLVEQCSLCTHNIPHSVHFSEKYSEQHLCLLCHWSQQVYEAFDYKYCELYYFNGSTISEEYNQTPKDNSFIYFSHRAPPLFD